MAPLGSDLDPAEDGGVAEDHSCSPHSSLKTADVGQVFFQADLLPLLT